MEHRELIKSVKNLPDSPGIYLFKDANNKPLYIGKALNIKNRVSQYLKTADPRLLRMVSEAEKIDFVKAENEIEALIMESEHIRNKRPDFNIMLRDDKQYFYIGFTNDDFPKIFLTHQPNWAAEFVGPFTDGNALKTTLKLLRKIFPYCACRTYHNNYCLNYHIGKCPGYCCLKKNTERPITSKEKLQYKKNIKNIKEILSGNKEFVLKSFEKEMQNVAKNEKFEEAMELQNKIEKLKRVFENARLINAKKYSSNSLEQLKESLGLEKIPNRIEAYDIANIQGKFAAGAMIVFNEGKINKNEYRKFKIYTKSTPDDTGMLKEVLIRRFNHPEWSLPELILIDGGKGQFNLASSITKSYGLNIPIIALTKNERHIGEKIFITGKKEALALSRLPLSLKNLLLQIDSEAHRFAISYYRSLHKRSLR